MHHLLLALASSTCAAILYATRPYPDIITRLSFATAYPALFLIVGTLVIGPLKLLSGARIRASMDLRRDIGIWAAAWGLLHTAIGQCVHLRGSPWLYYLYSAKEMRKHQFPIRHDIFGLSNFAGLAAALVLLLLLATSNDISLRRLGTPAWKQLQRWNYVGFGLIAIHTFGYQIGVEHAQWAFVGAAIAALMITLMLQLVGRQRWRGMTDSVS